MSLSASSVDPSAMLSCLNSSSLGSSTLLPSLPPLSARETDDRYSDSAFAHHSLLSKIGDQLTEFIANSNQQTTSSNSLFKSMLDRLERMENALESHFTDLTDAVSKRRSSSQDPESPRSSKRPRSSTPARKEETEDEDEAEKKRQADKAAADEAEKKKQQDLLDEIRRQEEEEEKEAENDKKRKQEEAEARRVEEEAKEARRKQREELKKKLQASGVSSKR